MKLFGIPNCNTVRKSRVWLAENGIAIDFHDFKKQGVTETLLKRWLEQIPWDKLVNRQGLTWRQLPDETKVTIRDQASAIALMLEKPSVIKRPVLEYKDKIYVGFDEALYHNIFGTK